MAQVRAEPSVRAYVLALASAALGFLVITLATAHGWLLPVDEPMLRWIAAHRDCGDVALATGLSFAGAGEVSLLLTALLAAVCLVRRRSRAAAALLLLYLSVPIELGLKLTLAQPLPGVLFPIPGACEWYHPTISVLTPHSYPSGYAIRVTYFFVLAAAWLLHRQAANSAHVPQARLRARLIMLLLAGVLALLLASRLVLSWHWPTDLLGGALLGGALATATLLASHHAAPVQPVVAGRR
ncbi:MAG TPA: phosphatase PAP2 family protein [Chloroflexota bacterium]|nr:phosphatase PAP2 family protein [Chloroflexota bacterium]